MMVFNSTETMFTIRVQCLSISGKRACPAPVESIDFHQSLLVLISITTQLMMVAVVDYLFD